MPAPFDISRPETDLELRALVSILARAFDTTAESAERYRSQIGDEHFRVARHADGVVGGLALIPKGQFFGSRSVPMTGVAAVAVAPEHRGRGVATALMEAAVEELYSDGVALSTLFPATEPLYRKSGYEHAGGRYAMEIPLASIGIRPGDLPVRELDLEDATDHQRIHAIYEHRALRNNGNLDRVTMNWAKLMRPHGVEVKGYQIGADDDPQGYCYLAHERTQPPFEYSVRVTDFAALTGDAARRMLALLASHQSQGDKATLNVGPTDPLFALLPEQHYRVRLLTHWMLRIVHLPTALQARGYGPGRNAELHLDVRDDLLEGNRGSWILRVEDGHGRVERGGRGELSFDIRALAPLYSGQLGARTLEAMGWLQGGNAAVRQAASLFDGPAPWMNDDF